MKGDIEHVDKRGVSKRIVQSGKSEPGVVAGRQCLSLTGVDAMQWMVATCGPCGGTKTRASASGGSLHLEVCRGGVFECRAECLVHTSIRGRVMGRGRGRVSEGGRTTE